MTQLATLTRSFPTFTAPFRWIGRSRRRIWATVLVALALVAASPLWWATQLVGLPDLGDPFDVAAFRAMTIPDERNAYRLYEEAWARSLPLGNFITVYPTKRIDTLLLWPAAAPEVRQWADANREALALYRRASEMPDALAGPPEFQAWHREIRSPAMKPLFFQELALLEGSRLEANGDTAGAWGWYRANLRTIHLVSLYGTVFRRRSAQDWHGKLNWRVAAWAANPRTTREMIRQALDDVLACEALAPSESYTLKGEYTDIDRLLDDPHGLARIPPRSWRMALLPLGIDLSLGPEHARSLYDTWRFTFREPERSRRVLRQAFANWLAYYDLPESARPRADPSCDGVVDFFYPRSRQSKPERGRARARGPRALD